MTGHVLIILFRDALEWPEKWCDSKCIVQYWSGLLVSASENTLSLPLNTHGPEFFIKKLIQFLTAKVAVQQSIRFTLFVCVSVCLHFWNSSVKGSPSQSEYSLRLTNQSEHSIISAVGWNQLFNFSFSVFSYSFQII